LKDVYDPGQISGKSTPTDLARLRPPVRRSILLSGTLSSAGVQYPVKKTQIAHTQWGDIEYFEEDQFIGKSLREYGWYSKGEIDFFAKALNSKCLVIEVGANIGSLTISIARMAGWVLAFEPQPENFELLASNARRNSLANLLVRHTAVGAQRGLTTLPYLQELGPVGNFGGVEINQGTYPVAMECLDDVCRDLRLPRCDLIKVDVEGYELEVFKGAQEIIRKFRPCLYFENDRPEKSEALLSFVSSLGYRMYPHQTRLDEGASHNIWEQPFASFNVLGVPNESPLQVVGEPIKV
jgi:FkbM family methyltransferase